MMLLVIDWNKVSNSELKKMPILSVRRFLSSLVGKMKIGRQNEDGSFDDGVRMSIRGTAMGNARE
ncbi:hypothetical protein JZ785_07115 [Alicyclobacillus curvatus]|nr:hypothetical protein JZ785_07115 [Alicyclobacillus curvatus]